MSGAFFSWVKRLFGGEPLEVRRFEPGPDDGNLMNRRNGPGTRKLMLADIATIASDGIRHGEGTVALQRLCLAYMQGAGAIEISRLERDVLPHHDQAAELLRHLEIAFDSLAIIEKSKNPNTLTSRLFVARQSINQSNALAAEVFTDTHRDELIGVLDEAASGQLADLAIGKVQAFQAKAAAAKTDATRRKNLAAAGAYAAEAAQHPNVSAADKQRIRKAAKPNKAKP